MLGAKSHEKHSLEGERGVSFCRERWSEQGSWEVVGLRVGGDERRRN